MERRLACRRRPAPDEPMCRIRLRTGRELAVVDVSNGGALVEGARLLPGTHVDVHVTTPDGRVLVRSRVVRSYVADLQSNAVRYRGALAFDRPIDTSRSAGYAMPSLVPANREHEGSDYPVTASSAITTNEHRMTA
jgi:hypothetical protein